MTQHRGEKGEYIFSVTGGLKPIAGWTKAKARMMRGVCAASSERAVVSWTPHDLHRTVATQMAEKLGISGEKLIKKMLGHSNGSVTAIYNRYGYVKEMRATIGTTGAGSHGS